MFVYNNFAGGTAQGLVQYSLSTPFDITSSVNFEGNFSGVNGQIADVEFSDDGMTAFFVDRFGSGQNNIQQFSLTNPFDFLSGTVSNEGFVSLDDNIPGVSSFIQIEGVTFNDDGSVLLVNDRSTGTILEYDVATPFDVLSGLTFTGAAESLDVNPPESTPLDVTFTPDGSGLYVLGEQQDSIFFYELGTNFDVSTAVLSDTVDLSVDFGIDLDGINHGLALSEDGANLYLSNTSSTNVFQFSTGFSAGADGVDTDGDGIIDSLDLDSDNDGISDLAESGADIALHDPDGDGVIDAAQFVDADSDGLADAIETINGVDSGTNLIDTDADGIDDVLDLDSDNDGIADVIEGQDTATFTEFAAGDSDSDGIADVFDGLAGHGSDGGTICLLYTSPSPRDRG